MTGQWTYQFYGAPHQQGQGYSHLQQQQQQLHLQQQQQQQHMIAPMQQVSYSQQHTAHLTHHQYNPNSLHHNSPPLGPAPSPQMWQQQQQSWGLLSPSAHGAGAAGGLPAASAVGGFGPGWDLSSDEGDEEEEEEMEAWAAMAGGTWEKFFDGRGLPVWIHSKTAARTSVNPATA